MANEFGLWIPAFAGMTVMVRLPWSAQVALQFRWLPFVGANNYSPLHARQLDFAKLNHLKRNATGQHSEQIERFYAIIFLAYCYPVVQPGDMTQIEDVKSRLDIVELVGGYVQLQRSGGSFKANCPFHQERTPSFYVFPDRQSWRCFGACAEGGDAFSFVMKSDRVDFREALHRLGARVGIAIVNQQETGGRSQQLYEVNDAARQFFQQTLATPEAEFVRDYLHRRGITERSAQIFEFGYSPPRDNRLLAHLTGAGYAPELIAEAGLARETPDSSPGDGRYYDLFRGRLMIPIRDWQARVAGFGSRALDQTATAKYLNTPRTPVFDKSRILFAMHLAKEPVRQHGAVIVEGYMDAVMAHQHGFDNVVASMGTALTEHQVAAIRRLTGQVTMALDGDPAGRNATLRSLESSWGVFQQRNARAAQQAGVSVLQQPEALELRVAELPAGLDPDDYIRQSPEGWPTFVAEAAPLFDYLLASLSERADLGSADGRAWVAQTMLRFVAQIPDPIRRDIYLDDLSARLAMNSETLRAALPTIAGESSGARRRRDAPDTANDAAPPPSRDENPVEEMLLALLLQHGDDLAPDDLGAVAPEWFSRSENREIYRSVFIEGVADGSTVAPELEPHLDLLRGRELMLSSPAKPERAWHQIRLTIEREYLKKEIEQLSTVDDALESPVANRLIDNKDRLGEIDRLLRPASPRQP